MALSWFPWNGSKRWLLDSLTPVLRQWPGAGTFIDPFVGGGSVAFCANEVHPTSPQLLNDSNPWLVSAYEAQQTDGFHDLIPGNITKAWIDQQRAYTDDDLGSLSVPERALRFAVCLLTAWGNRWETRASGEFRSTVNKRYCGDDYLRARLLKFDAVRWLGSSDQVSCEDWSAVAERAEPGDLVYLDPPYPESLGYGNQEWRFNDHLDVLDYAVDASKRGVSVVVSNMEDLERLYRRGGLGTEIITGPKRSKTRAARREVLAWKIVN